MRKLAVLMVLAAMGTAQGGQPPPIPTPSPTASSAVSLDSISISPLDPVIRQDDTVQLVATARFSNGAVQSHFDASWASSDPTIAQVVNVEGDPRAPRGMARAASIGPPGTVLGMAGGVAIITARVNNLVTTTQVTVLAGPEPTPTETPTQLPSATPSPTPVPTAVPK